MFISLTVLIGIFLDCYLYLSENTAPKSCVKKHSLISLYAVVVMMLYILLPSFICVL